MSDNGNENRNQLVTAPAPRTAALGDAISYRQRAEIESAMAIAKRFPRDTIAAYTRIMKSCERYSLAVNALYAYTRGGARIEGPSIRLAEALAQNWGNLDFGVIELEQRDGESDVMSYCWDLETNVRQVKVFSVLHERHSGRGDSKRITQLDDPRDVYETLANQGARRLRGCILGIIPGDIVDAAVEKCHETLKKGAGMPLEERIRKMVGAFDKLGVTRRQVELYLGHKVEATSEAEIARLVTVHKAIVDGFAPPEKYFTKEEPTHEQQRTEQPAGPAPAETPTAEETPAAPAPAPSPAPAPKQPPTKPAPRDAVPMSDEDQRQRLNARRLHVGLTMRQFQDELKAKYKVKTPEKLTREQAEEYIRELRARPRAEGPTTQPPGQPMHDADEDEGEINEHGDAYEGPI